MDDNILSSDDTTTDSFFKPYMTTREKNNIEKEDEQRKTKRKCNNSNLEEKFEAIKSSVGPNEEYIAIRRCEYNAWERNEERLYTAYSSLWIWRIDLLYSLFKSTV
ncbi:hypothetical protein Tco_1239988, partial [Tanacetum coccineum]